MANRQSRSPGEVRKFEANAQIGNAPSFAVDTGEAFRALEQLGGTVSARLKRMADGAAEREGDAAGLSAGARAGQKFVEKIGLEARGEARPAPKGKTPGTGETPASAPATSPAGLNSTPLQLRSDGTIRGEAFDAAAMKAYGWRMQAGLSVDLMAAYDDHKDSPGGYEAAVAQIRDKYLEDQVLSDGPLREAFEKIVVEKTATARLSIQSRQETRLAAEARSAATEGVEAVRLSLERDAYNLGANPAANWILAGQTKRALTAIDVEIADGTFSAAEGEKKKKQLQATVFAARTEGTFDALPTPAQQEEFALSIMDDYAEGDGPFAEMTLAEAKGLSGELFRRARSNQNNLTAESKAEMGRLAGLINDDVASIAATGQGLDAGENALTVDRVETLLGAEEVEKWQAARELAQKGWEATAGMELETPAELSERLTALEPKPGQEGFADQQQIHAAAVKQARAVLEERETDPLGQAHRAKLVTLEPIDGSSPEALANSLALRKQQANVVASEYGIDPVVFRPSERTHLAKVLLDQPELLPGFAASVSETFGELAPQALSELSEAGPELAQAAGIALATGNASVAADIAEVLAGRRDKTISVKMPTDGVLTNAAGAVLGGALAQNGQARAAIVGTANLLFEREAAALGFDPAEVKDPDSQAFAAYQRAVDRALGAQTIQGVKWGGLVEINGGEAVAPSFMPAEKVQQILDTLSDEDLGALPPIATANGIDVRARDLRRAQLVTIGDGLYRLALGDPDSFDPQFVMDATGGFWTLDLEAVQAARASRPASTFSTSVPMFTPFGMVPTIGLPK